jgi:hypothetical protein
MLRHKQKKKARGPKKSRISNQNAVGEAEKMMSDYIIGCPTGKA